MWWCSFFSSLSLAALKSGWALLSFVFFFFNDTATTEIYTLSLHDALPISLSQKGEGNEFFHLTSALNFSWSALTRRQRSEEHTSELQSQSNLVCRLLLEKKKESCVIIPPIQEKATKLPAVSSAAPRMPSQA